ncbi:hypothetical protein MSG28_006457 [Choristoneura fumiferana]|uniref:Uncharacterized protein n=1 Tax=Choristoneura fumiferana TaxID=7141 RepID=A0ACC0JF38_CHOFU|nr:hypothetical protein MSG28_006457 [Choristoneura fumiferana]
MRPYSGADSMYAITRVLGIEGRCDDDDDDDDDLSVCREDLAELKKGEETKSKDYEALCIKLDHSEFDEVSDPMAPVAVTAADIARINAFRNTPADDPAAAAVRLVQRTPIRVLHRRPLLARDKHILSMRAEPGTRRCWCCGCARAPARTSKSSCTGSWGARGPRWAPPSEPGRPAGAGRDARGAALAAPAPLVAPGPLGRTRPALGAALGARADLLALDVTRVALPWPPPPR